jgi:hypothetical protein
MNLLAGQLSETPVNDVLLQLRGNAHTGILTLQNDEDIVAISVEKGAIVGADALNEPLEQGLGAVLVAEGAVTEAQIEAAAARVSLNEGRIGDLLIEGGLISREDYLAVLRRYTLVLIQRIKTWDDGEFKFYVGDEVSYEEGFEPIRMTEVLDETSLMVEDLPDPGDSASASIADAQVAEPSVPAPADLAFDEDDGGAAGAEAFAVEEEPEPDDSLGEAVRRRAVAWLDSAPEWVAQVAPLLVILALTVVVVWRPNSLIYPFFWLESDRLELEKQRRTSVYMKIDRAARTFFLLEGRFPDDLHTLVSRGLLGPKDVVGSGGRILSYLPGDRGYVIRPGSADGTDPGVSKIEAIAGDFFLDPEFTIHLPDRGPAPLILLD